MSQSATGGCLCEEIEFTFPTSNVLDAFHCSCTACQKRSGAGKAGYIVVPSDDFELLFGSLCFYKFSGDHGENYVSGFCASCGCHIAGYYDSNKGITLIPIGVIDETEWVKVTSHRWASKRLAWDLEIEGLEIYDTKPLGQW